MCVSWLCLLVIIFILLCLRVLFSFFFFSLPLLFVCVFVSCFPSSFFLFRFYSNDSLPPHPSHPSHRTTRNKTCFLLWGGRGGRGGANGGGGGGCPPPHPNSYLKQKETPHPTIFFLKHPTILCLFIIICILLCLHFLFFFFCV